MEEPKKNKTNEDDDKDLKAIEVIKEEYDKKVKELEEKHKKDLEEQEKRLEEKHAKQIRALFLDGSPNQPKSNENNDEEDNRTFEERVLEKMKQKLKINKEN